MPDKKTKKMTLTTHTRSGVDCVDRDPPRINSRRKDIDVIHLVNGNAADSELTITVTIDAQSAANLFSPVPSAQIDLDPGDSVDWVVRSGLTGTVSLKFQTDPPTCHGADQDDVIVKFDADA